MTNKNNDLPQQAAESTLGLNPVIGFRGKDILTSARMVLMQALKQPKNARGVFSFKTYSFIYYFN